jgi:Flp pilus assembly protein TadB
MTTLFIVLCGIGGGIGVVLAVSGMFSREPTVGKLRITQHIDPATRQAVVFALIGGAAMGLITLWPAGFFLGAGAGWIIRSVVTPTASKATITRLDALATWMESLRDSVASHRGMLGAIESTATAAPPSIQPNIQALVLRIRAGVPFDQTFLALANELDDASADEAIAPLILASQFGGSDLQRLLDSAATNARDHLAIWQRTEMERAKPRREMRTIMIVTVAFVLLTLVIGHGYFKPFGTSTGQLMLVAMAGLFATGFAVMGKLAKPQPMPRILGGEVSG